MRTAVDIPDETYRKLKSKAARQGRSVRALILRGVHRELALPQGRRRIRLPLVRSRRPGTLEIDNERSYRIIALP